MMRKRYLKLQFFMKHPLLNLIRIPVLLVIVSALVFYFEGFGNLGIGKYIYRCVENPVPLTSFPCYGGVDLGIMLLMAGIFISSILISVIRIILFCRKSKKF
jgi:hypothetical protein